MVPYLKDPQAIYERSFAIVREQAVLDEVPDDLREVAVRVIHACGMPDIVDAIDASPDFASGAIEALRNGAPVLCDCEMVASGITRRFLDAGNEVIVTLNDPEVPARAKAQQTTRSAAAVDLWRPWIDGSVIVVGNAPTALFRCLEIIGEEVSRKVLDDRLGKDTRKDLVSCLVLEGLDAFMNRREPAVSQARISQTLRAADHEIREWAALEVRQFQEYAFKDGQGPRSLGKSFRLSIKPFLERVWPQERSLATSGVSHQLAGLPAVSGEAFADAVHEIERFLTPFDCRSMLAYGFYEGNTSKDLGMPQLSDAVDDSPKAQAFLHLLDLTIGNSETAAVPEDLGAALDRIESLAPKLTSDPAFQRLAAAARR